MADSVGTVKKIQQKPKRSKSVTRHFGLALRKMREAKGMRLLDLAEHLDVSLPYLSDVERGRREPLSNDRIKLAALHLEGDALLLIEEAIRDRGFVTLPIDDRDNLRVKAAMMLVVALPDAGDDVVRKIINTLKASTA
jgi:transcriptional regulator with XRE-family HTH domain